MFSIEGPDRRKEEERVRSEGRLPPGQSLTLKFPVLHYGPVPPFNPATWNFRVWGEVETEKEWSWEQFNKLPRSRVEMDIHCVTRWSKFDTAWEGVSVGTLVKAGLIKPKPQACYVMEHAEYGFTTNLPLEVVLSDNFLMASAHVAHNCRLGDGVILANGVLLAGHVTVDNRAFISGNCVVHQFVRIGESVIGAFVVGPPLPTFDLEREEMRKYYEARYQAGFDFAYVIPAMSKAVQAAGRVIRSESFSAISVNTFATVEPGWACTTGVPASPPHAPR